MVGDRWTGTREATSPFGGVPTRFALPARSRNARLEQRNLQALQRSLKQFVTVLRLACTMIVMSCSVVDQSVLGSIRGRPWCATAIRATVVLLEMFADSSLALTA